MTKSQENLYSTKAKSETQRKEQQNTTKQATNPANIAIQKFIKNQEAKNPNKPKTDHNNNNQQTTQKTIQKDRQPINTPIAIKRNLDAVDEPSDEEAIAKQLLEATPKLTKFRRTSIQEAEPLTKNQQ